MVHASKILGTTKTNMLFKTLFKGKNKVDNDTSNLDIPKFCFWSMKKNLEGLEIFYPIAFPWILAIEKGKLLFKGMKVSVLFLSLSLEDNNKLDRWINGACI